MKLGIHLNLVCRRILKISRHNIVYKSISASILLHLISLFLLILAPHKNIQDTPLQINILEDSKVVSESDKEKIKEAIHKDEKKYKTEKEKVNKELKKLQKAIDESSRENFAQTQQDEELVKSLDEALNKEQVKRRGTNYQLSKKASRKWKLEQEELSEKKQLKEIVKASIITKEIQWKHATRRKIISRPKVEYPSYYRQKGIQGKTRLLIKVDHSGNVVAATVISSSGYSKLDVIAKKVIRATQFSPIDKLESEYDEAEIDIHFRLTD